MKGRIEQWVIIQKTWAVESIPKTPVAVRLAVPSFGPNVVFIVVDLYGFSFYFPS